MPHPRTLRRKQILISSDTENNASPTSSSLATTQTEAPRKGTLRSNGHAKLEKPSRAAQKSATAARQSSKSQISPSKPKKADESESHGRTMFSFFNTATQRQGSSQPPPSPCEAPALGGEADAILDDSDNASGSVVCTSKGSITALAMRKRKVERNGSTDNSNALSPPASQKFRKARSGDRIAQPSTLYADERPWTDQFAPNDLQELAVHNRKVLDVRKWLEMTAKGKRRRVLVLKGAAGTGKTTTARLLAKEMNAKVIEWRNPSETDMSLRDGATASSQFHDFIFRAGRSASLELVASSDVNAAVSCKFDPCGGGKPQILLVEEFPSTYSRTSSSLDSFRSTVLQYLASSPASGSNTTPVVMIISEALLSSSTALADSFTVHRLLGHELINHPFLDMIEFNPIAPTILIKALETVAIKEARRSGRRRTPGSSVLKHLAATGDIRSAISTLEFLCIRGDAADAWSSKVTFTKQKKPKTQQSMTKAEADSLRLISNRESTLGIFHAVGKVVYNKRYDPPANSMTHPPPWFPQHRRGKIPENDPDDVMQGLGTDISTFVAALHENYISSCSTSGAEETLDSLFGCIDSLSDSDLLSAERLPWGRSPFAGSTTDGVRQEEMSYHVAFRGLLFNLPQTVQRSLPPDRKRGNEYRIFYPASLKLWKGREEVESKLELVFALLQNGATHEALALGNKSGPTLGGVETWRRNTGLDVGPTNSSADGFTPLTGTRGARKDVLLERLPYMAQIFGSRGKRSNLLEQISSITEIRGSDCTVADSEAEIDDDGRINMEQETVGNLKAENEPRKGSKSRATSTRGQSNIGASTSIDTFTPRIDNLVLEQDDIVDD